MLRDAVVSDDGVFRYWLLRQKLADVPVLPFCMLNPSKADSEIDDPTARKIVEFSTRLGYGGACAINMYAYRATDPRDLKQAGYLIGPDNDTWLRYVATSAALQNVPLICAWGAHARGTDRVDEVLKLFRETEVCLMALKLLDDGTPAHPLMLPYSCVNSLVRL